MIRTSQFTDSDFKIVSTFLQFLVFALVELEQPGRPVPTCHLSFPERQQQTEAQDLFPKVSFVQVRPQDRLVKVLKLRERFPGAELVIDVFSPFLIRANNLRLSITKLGARYHWGLKRGQELESWGEGIRLLGEWGYFDRPEPRLAHIQWMRRIPLLARVLRIYHYRLGEAKG